MHDTQLMRTNLASHSPSILTLCPNQTDHTDPSHLHSFTHPHPVSDAHRPAQPSVLLVANSVHESVRRPPSIEFSGALSAADRAAQGGPRPAAQVWPECVGGRQVATPGERLRRFGQSVGGEAGCHS
eukprot:365595-Chlamydomonas_euryale.AAC.6